MFHVLGEITIMHGPWNIRVKSQWLTHSNNWATFLALLSAFLWLALVVVDDCDSSRFFRHSACPLSIQGRAGSVARTGTSVSINIWQEINCWLKKLKPPFKSGRSVEAAVWRRTTNILLMDRPTTVHITWPITLTMRACPFTSHYTHRHAYIKRVSEYPQQFNTRFGTIHFGRI